MVFLVTPNVSEADDVLRRGATHAQAIVAPFTYPGHIIPAIRLTEILATKYNMSITFVLPKFLVPSEDKFASASSPTGRLLYAMQHHANVQLIGLQDESNGLITSFKHAFTHPESMQQPLEELITEMLGAQPASHTTSLCIISDMLMAWTQDVAIKFRIPRYVFYPGLAVSMAWVLYLPELQKQRHVPLPSAKPECQGDAEDDFITIPGLPPCHRRQWNTMLLDSIPLEAHEVYAKNCLRTREAAGILIDTFEDLEPAAFAALDTHIINPKGVPIYAVGPLLHNDQSTKAEDISCMQWLDKQPPASVVYVCFGSVYDPTAVQVQEIAHGLKASDQRFLWVLRPGPGTTVSDVSSFLPEGFLSDTQNQGLVLFGWAPQHLILSHPSVGVFFSHCGYSSVMETISAGMPVIGFPQFADHYLNCKMLEEELGMGVEALRREVDGVVEREEVQRTVGLAMVGKESERLRRNAKKWREVASKAVWRLKAADGQLQNGLISKRSLGSFVKEILHVTF